jgi:hypothetical protein
VKEAPAEAAPLELIASALQATALIFPDERRPYSRLRQTVIDQNPALQERELHKLAGLAATVATALHAQGVAEPTGPPSRPSPPHPCSASRSHNGSATKAGRSRTSRRMYCASCAT